MTRPAKRILILLFVVAALAAAYTAINFDINHILPKNIVAKRNAMQVFAGIDVSHHQGNINWKQVGGNVQKPDFVYVKATEGASYVDPKFRKNVTGARNNGFLVGAYHYFRMTSSAHDQFRNFKGQIDKNLLDLIPMVDVETDDKKPRAQVQDSLKVLLDLLEKEYGRKPMIYGTQRSYNSYCAPEFNDYPLYIGKYSEAKPVIIGSGNYTIWQYSETGSIKGIPGGVDLCRFHPSCSIEHILME